MNTCKTCKHWNPVGNNCGSCNKSGTMNPEPTTDRQKHAYTVKGDILVVSCADGRILKYKKVHPHGNLAKKALDTA